jgi:hypothetical protein
VIFGADGRIVSSGNVVAQQVGDSLQGGGWLDDGSAAGHPDFLYRPIQVLNPADPHVIRPEIPSTNPELDLNWIRQHLLAGGDI